MCFLCPLCKCRLSLTSVQVRVPRLHDCVRLLFHPPGAPQSLVLAEVATLGWPSAATVKLCGGLAVLLELSSHLQFQAWQVPVARGHPSGKQQWQLCTGRKSLAERLWACGGHEMRQPEARKSERTAGLWHLRAQ